MAIFEALELFKEAKWIGRATLIVEADSRVILNWLRTPYKGRGGTGCQEVQNFFHPCPLVFSIGSSSPSLCCVCFGVIHSQYHYRCRLSCPFKVHVECALMRVVEYSDGKRTTAIQHFTHRHPLKSVGLKQQKDKVVCAMCEKVCSSSSSSSTYGCLGCKFFLHRSCMDRIPRKLIDQPIHPCTLVFLTYPNPIVCDKCNEATSSRMMFTCGACAFNLHAKCAVLPTIDSEDAEEIQHFSHPHPLALVKNDRFYGNEPEARCVARVETCSAPTPTFRCTRSSCNHFFLHKPCALKLLPQPLQIQDPSHPKHKLTVTSLPYNDHSRTCGACYRGIDSSLLAYTCGAIKCGFSLHLDGTKLLPSFSCNGHPHLLTLFDKTPDLACHICGVSCNDFTLRCVPCNFIIHLQCHPSTPKTINHESHLHPLTLTKSPLEFELNSDQDVYNSEVEFYCDVCEERRHKRESVYYCADCKFIAELKCIIPSVTVLPLIPKTKHVQQAPPAGFSDNVGDYDGNDDDDERSPFCKVLYNLIKLEQKKNEAEESPWEISRALYQLRKLEQMKNELEKLLESVTTEMKETKDSLGMESLRI
ncbi:hypothetical protein V6N13_016261 [Hibiscus sabdariffa]